MTRRDEMGSEVSPTMRKLFSVLAMPLLIQLISGGPQASAAQTKSASAEVVPRDTLVHDGIPSIPAELGPTVVAHNTYLPSKLVAWDPSQPQIIIGQAHSPFIQAARIDTPGAQPKFFTSFPERVREFYFQPQGKYLVYAKDEGGNERIQLYRYDIDTRASTLLTDGKSWNGYPIWSKSGKWLIYSSTRRNAKDMDIYIVDPLDPKSDRELVRLEGENWAAFDWSDDEQRIILSDYRSPNQTYLWLMDLSGGTKTLLTPDDVSGKAFNGSYAYFSRDGHGIYLSTDRGSEFRRLAYLDLRTMKPKWLTGSLNWDIDEFRLSPNGAWLAFVSNEAGVGVLHVMNTSTFAELAVPGLQVGVMSGLVWSNDSAYLGFVLESTKNPADVFSIRISDLEVKRWTKGYTKANASQFKDPELVKWRTFDGRMISGFVYRPPDRFTGRRPVIVDIHGGPYSQFRPRYLGDENYLINELGIVTIHPNIRGSLGFGKSFLKLDDGYLRDDANKDVGALLDWIAKQPDLDANKVMVEGGSHGGYVALSVACEYPTRIAAVFSYVGVTNLATFLARGATVGSNGWRQEYGDERDPRMRDFQEKIAPANNANKIRAPLFLAIGANDPYTSAEECRSMVRAVRNNGIPAWFLMATNEGHGFMDVRNYDYVLLSKALFVQLFLLKSEAVNSRSQN
jgi:dipeptidyl aminopeptidase/acylaminoacyl peptidase